MLFVILKPVTLIVLSLAGNAAAAGLSFGSGVSGSVGTILAAIVIFALAAFAPWALMYLLAADAESAYMAAGMRAAAGAAVTDSDGPLGTQRRRPAQPQRPERWEPAGGATLRRRLARWRSRRRRRPRRRGTPPCRRARGRRRRRRRRHRRRGGRRRPGGGRRDNRRWQHRRGRRRGRAGPGGAADRTPRAPPRPARSSQSSRRHRAARRRVTRARLRRAAMATLRCRLPPERPPRPQAQTPAAPPSRSIPRSLAALLACLGPLAEAFRDSRRRSLGRCRARRAAGLLAARRR